MLLSGLYTLVGGKGLEPSRLAALAPKASVSTNSTIRPFNRGILLDFAVKDQLGVAVVFSRRYFGFVEFQCFDVSRKR